MAIKKTENTFDTVLDWVGFGAIIVIAAAMLSAVIHHFLQIEFPYAAIGVWIASVVLALIAVLIAAHFIVVFTRDLSANSSSKPSQNNESLPPRLKTVFVYGYILMLAALSLCAAPFFVPIDAVDHSTEEKLSVGVVVGCRSSDCAETGNEPQWLLHIGSSISTLAIGDQPESNELKGGLVVPLYIVLLALMGGSVSMIRRVPEYQRQATAQSSYKNADKVPSITPIRARELVVFQIMQVFTAPLIAVTAFSVFDPDTVTSGALLGFLSGFTSETILLRLRVATDALSGRTNKVTTKDATSPASSALPNAATGRKDADLNTGAQQAQDGTSANPGG